MEIAWPFGPVSADMATISASINRNTEVTFSAFTGKQAGEGANRVFSAEAAALMGRAQQLAHSARSTPDCSARFRDGGGGELNLRGYLSGPSYAMDRSSITPAFTFLSEMAAMASLRLEVYTAISSRKAGDSEPLASGTDTLQQVCREDNLASRLKSLTQKMIEYWQTNKPREVSKLAQDLAEQRHTINTSGPLALWYKLLDNSVTDVTNDWLPLFAKSASNSNFNGELLAMLKGSNRDFMEVVGAIQGSFQLVMIPAKDGGPGKFIPISAMVTGRPRSLVLPAGSMTLRGHAGGGLLPVQQVLMLGTPQLARDIGVKSPSQQLQGGYNVGAFPASASRASGDVVIEPVPFYLQKIIDYSGKSATTPRGPGGGDPDNRNLGKGLSDLRSGVATYEGAIGKLITDYCRSFYLDRAVGSTSTSIQIPCDLSLWPGERFAVRDAEGSDLFSGFLSSVTHSFSQQNGAGNASTSLSFSHILFPGFTLPDA